MSKVALVAGGTGLVGSILVDLLIEEKLYDEVKVLIRKGSNYKNANANVIEVDYDCLSEYSEVINADAVFCCLGTTIKKAGSKKEFIKVDFTYPLELAKIAMENKSDQFNIITAMGANARSGVFYNKVKGEIEDAISILGIHEVNIFRPSLLIGERKESRTGELIGVVLFKIINPLLLGSLKKYRSIEAQIVAKAMANISMESKKGIAIILSDNIMKYGQTQQ